MMSNNPGLSWFEPIGPEAGSIHVDETLGLIMVTTNEDIDANGESYLDVRYYRITDGVEIGVRNRVKRSEVTEFADRKATLEEIKRLRPTGRRVPTQDRLDYIDERLDYHYRKYDFAIEMLRYFEDECKQGAGDAISSRIVRNVPVEDLIFERDRVNVAKEYFDALREK